MNKKRKVKDIPIFLEDRLWDDLKNLVDKCKWPYKTNENDYWLQDKVLVCLLILTGLRISELLRLKKLQFRIYQSKILLANVQTLRHGLTRDKIFLPKKGRLATFTEQFEQWFIQVPKEENYIFPSGIVRTHGQGDTFNWNKPLGRKRAFWIIKTTTDRFPHWFRSVSKIIYGRIVFKSDAWKLKQFRGLQRLDSTTPYVKSSWEDDEDRPNISTVNTVQNRFSARLFILV
jgi:hypothetical protein